MFLNENCLKYAKARQKEVFVNQGLLKTKVDFYKTWNGNVNYFLDEKYYLHFFAIQVRVFTSKLNVPKTEPADLNAAQRKPQNLSALKLNCTCYNRHN